MKYSTLALSALLALGGVHAWAQTHAISSVAVSLNGVATVTQRTGVPGNTPVYVGDNLAGLTYVAGNVGMTGDAPVGSPTSIALFTLTGRLLPGGGPQATDFVGYGTLIAPTMVATYSDVAAQLTANSYSGLAFLTVPDTFSLPGPGSFYTIHHRATGDYFSVIVPATGGLSTAYDLKPMSSPGNLNTPGGVGYFGLAYASGAVATGYNANSMFYLRTAQAVDTFPAGHTVFGELIPALLSAPSDKFNLNTAVGSFGVTGYTTLAYSTTAVGGNPVKQFYYLRQDSITGHTILGRLNPSLVVGARVISDIANLGSVFSTLTFVADGTGPADAWGTNNFFVTGAPRPLGSQSVSFAAIADHNVGDVFTITPSASSARDLDVTVISGPATVQTTGVSGLTPSQRVFTVTTTGPGIVKLQARQAGSAAPFFLANLMQQSFNVLGLPSINSSTTAAATVGTPFTYNVTSTGAPILSYTAGPLPAGLSFNTTTGVISGTPTTVGATIVSLTSTNATGTSAPATVTITVAAAGAVPVITNNPLTAAGTVNALFNFAITASGSPTSYSASLLPAGLTVNTTTGVISGTPTAAGTTIVTLTATNGTGASTPVTLTITVAAATVVPNITSPTTAPGTVGTTFVTYQIVATGLPTSYSATGLPAGLTLNSTTGAINGTPTVAGVSVVTLGATNSAGTDNATLTITVAPAAVAPIITSPTTAPGTVGTPFVTYFIAATGLPTSFSATGLPPGLIFNALTGAINGTPTVAGVSVVTLGASNSTGSDTSTLTITVAPATLAPNITSASTAPGTVGTPFVTYLITATGLPTSFGATGLPAGLTVNALTGAINGTPTTAGTYLVTLRAANSTGTSTGTLTITIAPTAVAPIITSPSTAPGTVGSTFVTYFIAATGLPTSYGATGLPAGLTLNTLTGAINGTPTTAGTYVATLSATNSTGVGTATLTVTVAPATSAPNITSATTAPGTVGTPFATYLIGATGFPTSYDASNLPPGLTINTLTGAINGTPTTAGTFVVTVSATNSTGVTSGTLTITVAPEAVAPIITSATSAPGTVGTPFVTYVVAATGLPTSYTATGLPAGLTLNPLTGAINGTPTTAGVSVVILGASNSTGSDTATLTITVAAAAVAPIITSPSTAPATVGTPFVTYLIGATGLPTSYDAVGLPAGLTVNPLTGAINGTPTTAGVSVVTISATNATGTSSATLTITVAPAAAAPIITSASTAPGRVGTPMVTYVIAATGLPTSYSATGLPAGVTVNTLTGAINGTPTEAATYAVTIRATNATGTGTATLTITVLPASGVPVPVVTSPTAAVGTVGTPLVTYQITATGSPTSYSATGLPAGVTVNSSTGAINGTPTEAGHYTLTIGATNASGTGTGVVSLVVSAPAPSSRIVNFSARALSGPGDQTLIVGFVVAGNDKNLLVRGIGPTLAGYGVLNALADPMLTLYGPAGPIASNDDWQTTGSGQPDANAVAATAARVGAFPLPNGSKDSALLFTANDGSHTTSMLRPNSTSGVALTEIYDTDVAAGSRLINVSARMNVTGGEGTLIAGLAIAGNGGKSVLIRAVGPGLTAYGVAGVLADPQITVFAGSTSIASNDNWESGATPAAELASAFARVGAFPLPAGSKDAALLITLEPGNYTVQVTGVGNLTGVALVEVYDSQ